MWGDRPGFNPNTNQDRVRVDFALNTRTGKLAMFPAHTNGSEMDTMLPVVEIHNWRLNVRMRQFADAHANAVLEETITSTLVPKGSVGLGRSHISKGGPQTWRVDIMGEGWDPFYNAGKKSVAPPASPTSAVFARNIVFKFCFRWAGVTVDCALRVIRFKFKCSVKT